MNSQNEPAGSTFVDSTYKPIKPFRKKRESTIGISNGTRIFHRKFGEGTVIETDASDVIVIDFDNKEYGTKKLSLSLCMDSELLTPI